MSTTSFDQLRQQVHHEVGKAIVGHEEAIDLLLIAAVAGGHVLMEGPPGVAKTLLAGTMARALGVRFARIQFTADTTPGEVVGTSVVRNAEKIFLEGAVFTNVLLADEINRTPPKTQAALLEAMQERHVTVDGRTRWLPNPFLVIATQNPYEQEGVYSLPESQLDRFLFKVELGYGDEDEELRMLAVPHRGVFSDMIDDVAPLLDSTGLERVQRELAEVEAAEGVARAVVAIVRSTRERPGVVLGASPRAAMHLLIAAKASARLAGRDRVEVEDVARMARPVLSHRLIVESGTGEEAVRSAVDGVLDRTRANVG